MAGKEARRAARPRGPTPLEKAQERMRLRFAEYLEARALVKRLTDNQKQEKDNGRI